MRAHVLFLIIVSSAAQCLAGKSGAGSGASIDKAIRLKARTASAAVEEEMAWMKKLYHYTPLDATRDAYIEAIRQIEVEKKKEGEGPIPWGHASREYNGRLISCWWLRTPHGRKEVYFDTGLAINTPGEVARRESACARYMGERIPSLKLR
jgi:hypothetical protein